MDKMKDLIEMARGAVFGWRKLGVLIGILAASFGWLFKFTVKEGQTVTVPDLPLTFATVVVTLFLTFVVGNWGEHKAKNSGEKS